MWVGDDGCHSQSGGADPARFLSLRAATLGSPIGVGDDGLGRGEAVAMPRRSARIQRVPFPHSREMWRVGVFETPTRVYVPYESFLSVGSAAGDSGEGSMAAAPSPLVEPTNASAARRASVSP